MVSEYQVSRRRYVVECHSICTSHIAAIVMVYACMCKLDTTLAFDCYNSSYIAS